MTGGGGLVQRVERFAQSVGGGIVVPEVLFSSLVDTLTQAAPPSTTLEEGRRKVAAPNL